MIACKVGDEVRVFYWLSRKRREYPDGFPGKIIWVGKQRADVEFEIPAPDAEGGPRPAQIRFDLRSGFQSPDIEGFRVRTLEQAAGDQRRKFALLQLDDAGLQFRAGSERGIPTEQLEALAAIVKGWGEDNV